MLDYIRKEIDIVKGIISKYFSVYELQDQIKAVSEFPWIVARKIRKFFKNDEQDKIDLYNFVQSYSLVDNITYGTLRDDLRVIMRAAQEEDAINLIKNLPLRGLDTMAKQLWIYLDGAKNEDDVKKAFQQTLRHYPQLLETIVNPKVEVEVNYVKKNIKRKFQDNYDKDKKKCTICRRIGHLKQDCYYFKRVMEDRDNEKPRL